jgi:hypothetical protein
VQQDPDPHMNGTAISNCMFCCIVRISDICSRIDSNMKVKKEEEGIVAFGLQRKGFLYPITNFFNVHCLLVAKLF